LANNGFLSTKDLDFDSYKANLKTFLKGQDKFKDYDFEGSNMSVLLDIMAYNTYLNGFYLNMVGSEMFLDTATLKESVVSRSKELNYVPRSRVSAKALVNITINNVGNSAPSTITIPKNYYVSATANSRTYLFSTDEAIVVRNEGGSYSSGNTYVYEGRVASETFNYTTDTRIILASANVDISSLDVVVQTSITDTTNTVFSRAYNLYGLTDIDPVYFVQGYGADQYELVFGNGITGKQLVNGNVVKVSYRDVSADNANYITNFKAVSPVGIYSSVSVATLVASFGGAERETIDSIKFNAPRAFSAQDRAITKNDFAILIRNNFPDIQAISVFGGEELDQKRYGKVAVATKPYGAEITPDTVKTQIASFLSNRTSVAIDPIFIDPSYFYVEINTTVSYDTTLTTLTTSDIETLVRAQISNYNTTYLYDFDSDFRYSKVVQLIDAADTSVTSNDTAVKMIKRITPTAGINYTDQIKFNNAFDVESSAPLIPPNAVPIVSSSVFIYNGYNAFMRDDGQGNLYIYTTDIGSTETTLAQSVGTVDYTNGIVTISGFIVSSYSGHISIYARLKGKDIVISQNQIIIIDQADVSVTVVQTVF